MIPLVVTYICWGTFLVAWLVGALYNARYAPKAEGGPWVGFLGLARGWVLAVIVILLLDHLAPRSVWAPIPYHNTILAIVGVAIVVVFTAFTLWARWTLGTMWSPVPTRREHHELRTNGPYRFSRHPIYTGLLGMFVGSALVTASGSVLVALIVFAVVFAYRVKREEKILLDTFGDEYVRYQHRVPMLLPVPHF